MILFQTLSAYLQEGAVKHKSSACQKFLKLTKFVFLNESYLVANARFLAVYELLDMSAFFAAIFLCRNFAHSQAKKHQLYLNSMNTFRTQISENIKTHRRGCANIFSYLMSPTSILSPSSLVMSTTFVMLTTLMLSQTNISVKLVNLVLKKKLRKFREDGQTYVNSKCQSV